MNYKIAILRGDGIGPAVIEEGIKILKAIEKKFDYKFEYEEALIGGCAYEK
jgi:3-isopropylmalate dehydrogenase